MVVIEEALDVPTMEKVNVGPATPLMVVVAPELPREDEAINEYPVPFPIKIDPLEGTVDVPVPPPVTGVMGAAWATKYISRKTNDATERNDSIFFIIRRN